MFGHDGHLFWLSWGKEQLQKLVYYKQYKKSRKRPAHPNRNIQVLFFYYSGLFLKKSFMMVMIMAIITDT